MKKIGDYTCRGTIVGNGAEKVILFDGRFDTAYKVVEFRVAGDPNIETGVDGYGLLSTVDDSGITDGGDWRWENNDQLAWAATTFSGSGATISEYTLVDPDNLVVEDLYVYGRLGGGGAGINYFIRLEKYDITDSLGALAMVKNRSQT